MGISGVDPNTIIIALSTILAAIIAGVFDIIVGKIRRSRSDKRHAQKVQQGVSPKEVSQNAPWRLYLSILLVGTLIGYIIGIILTRSEDTFTRSSLEDRGRGNLIMNFGFNREGDGNCNDYDPDFLGYESGQYYIQPQPDRAFIAICHEIEDLSPLGDLEVSAVPVGNYSLMDTLGYGVLFGWDGDEDSTSDACIAGILRYRGHTFAYFTEVVRDEWQQDYEAINTFELDSAQHTLRVILQAGGEAIVFLDGRELARHKFTECSPGPIGMSAWNSLGNKVYFDNLTLYSLP